MGQLFYCIVAKGSSVPFYYNGYFLDCKPVISVNFSEALKLHSQEEAERIWNNLPHPTEFIIEEHMLMDAVS